MLKRPTIIVVALLTANGIAGAADLTAGRTLFKVCAPCHEIGVNARNSVGPSSTVSTAAPRVPCQAIPTPRLPSIQESSGEKPCSNNT